MGARCILSSAEQIPRFIPHLRVWVITSIRPLFRITAVSIHTPTWGVTVLPQEPQTVFQVSIHTPTWGVTRLCVALSPAATVSIHTPTWGVTTFVYLNSGQKCFNPHPYVRGDRRALPGDVPGHEFQSTPLREGWRRQARKALSRHRVSIHTPTWGVTIARASGYEFTAVSIHTPTWGVTLCSNVLFHWNMFQSTPLREGWRPARVFLHVFCSFNPHPYVRGDLRWWQI